MGWSDHIEFLRNRLQSEIFGCYEGRTFTAGIYAEALLVFNYYICIYIYGYMHISLVWLLISQTKSMLPVVDDS